MKIYRTENGPFPERPHYEAIEIERICDDALSSSRLLPTEPAPIRIDRFVEKIFHITIAYEPLPEGVLGYTEFGPNGVSEMVVSTAFDEEVGQVAERRVRSTLAHEAGHGLLHKHLFAMQDMQFSLLNDKREAPQVLCRDVQGEDMNGGSYDGRWWEWQANQAIGALLLPRILVKKVVDAMCMPTGDLGLPTLPSEKRAATCRELSDIFDVNPIVARIRLDQLYEVPE